MVCDKSERVEERIIVALVRQRRAVVDFFRTFGDDLQLDRHNFEHAVFGGHYVVARDVIAVLIVNGKIIDVQPHIIRADFRYFADETYSCYVLLGRKSAVFAVAAIGNLVSLVGERRAVVYLARSVGIDADRALIDDEFAVSIRNLVVCGDVASCAVENSYFVLCNRIFRRTCYRL